MGVYVVGMGLVWIKHCLNGTILFKTHSPVPTMFDLGQNLECTNRILNGMGLAKWTGAQKLSADKPGSVVSWPKWAQSNEARCYSDRSTFQTVKMVLGCFTKITLDWTG